MVRRTLLKSLIALALTGFVAVAVSAQTPAPKTASETYLAYLAAMKTAKKVDDVAKFLVSKNLEMLKQMPPAEQSKNFELLKMMVTSNTNVKVIKETPKGANAATLTVEGVGDGKQKATGTVDMVKEGGAWKVGNESWK